MITSCFPEKYEFHCQVQDYVVTIGSMQEEFLFGSKCVASEITCDRPSDDRKEVSNFPTFNSGISIWPPNLRVTIEVSRKERWKWIFIVYCGIFDRKFVDSGVKKQDFCTRQ